MLVLPGPNKNRLQVQTLNLSSAPIQIWVRFGSDLGAEQRTRLPIRRFEPNLSHQTPLLNANSGLPLTRLLNDEFLRVARISRSRGPDSNRGLGGWLKQRDIQILMFFPGEFERHSDLNLAHILDPNHIG